jgi:hypothetical protein
MMLVDSDIEERRTSGRRDGIQLQAKFELADLMIK